MVRSFLLSLIFCSQSFGALFDYNGGSFGSIQTKTGAYTALVTDGYINGSGAAFTVTLFAASGNAGKTLVIKKTDSSLTNIITIDGNASETIDGATTTTLNTQYESVTLYCDGSNWHILNRTIPKAWGSYTATITGTVIAGTMTYTANTLYWAREGDSVHVQGNIRINTVTTAPTGTTYINLPTGVAQATVAGSSDGGRGPWGVTASNVGTTSTIFNWLTIGTPDTGKMAFAPGRGTTPAIAASDEIKVNFVVPVSGWNQ